jgi:hypothetical protein
MKTQHWALRDGVHFPVDPAVTHPAGHVPLQFSFLRGYIRERFRRIVNVESRYFKDLAAGTLIANGSPLEGGVRQGIPP